MGLVVGRILWRSYRRKGVEKLTAVLNDGDAKVLQVFHFQAWKPRKHPVKAAG
jgi:hypothetical protein